MGIVRDPVSFSECFKLDEGRLSRMGVFNPILNVDTKLFIDPLLIFSSRGHRRFAKRAAGAFRRYFSDVIRLLVASQSRGDLPWKEARARLALNEAAGTCLGYGAGTIRGRGW